MHDTFGSSSRGRDFVLYSMASVASYAGSLLTYVVMPVLVYTLTRSPLYTSLVVAFEAVTYLAAGLFASGFAARHDRKRVLVATDAINAVLLASIPVTSLFGVLTVQQVLAVVVVTGVVTVFFDAAGFAALPLLVSRGRLAGTANSLSVAATLTGIAAPGIAAALLVGLPAPAVLAVTGAGFAACAVLLSAIGQPLTPPHEKGTVVRVSRRAAAEGLRYLWRHPTIRPMTVMSFAQCAYGGAALGQFVPLAVSVLGERRAGWGAALLFLAWSFGGFIASLLLPRLVRSINTVWIALLATPVSILGGILCAVSVGLVGLLTAIASWSVVYGVNASSNALHRRSVTPSRLLSRVDAGGRTLASGLATPLGAIAGGALAGVAGPRWTLMAGAAFAAVAMVIAWFSALRHEGLRRQSRPSWPPV